MERSIGTTNSRGSRPAERHAGFKRNGVIAPGSGSPLSSLAKALTLSLALLVALMLWGCDPGVIVHFRNNSSELLFVQINESGRDRLPPHSVRNLDYPPETFGDADDPLTIVIADSDGCIVLRVQTTLRRFREEADMTLAIAPEDLPPEEDRTDCDPNLAD